MKPYHKIDSIYKRDPRTKYSTFLSGQWSRPEFEYLADSVWMGEEKIDGTNIRITIEPQDKRTIQGRTNSAQIPEFLIDTLKQVAYHPQASGMEGLVLYGEGCGRKIQTGGENYNKTGTSFILFDVMMLSSGAFLKRSVVKEFAYKLGIRSAPEVFKGTLFKAIEAVKYKEIEAVAAADPTFFEGLVLRPLLDLRDRFGTRIITKIKTRDFHTVNECPQCSRTGRPAHRCPLETYKNKDSEYRCHCCNKCLKDCFKKTN